MSAWWLAACLAASPPDAGRAPVPFAWDVPGLLDLVPVGDTLARDGLPMTVMLARSKWALDPLLLHYAERFVSQGYFIPPRMGPLHGLSLPRLVALDPERLVSVLVYGWPEPDGTTTLVLGAARLGGRVARGGRGALPVFPGATRPTFFDVEAATALSFTVQASEAEVIDYYRQVLPSGGWVERDPGTFVRGGRQVRVLARKQARGVGIAVLEQPDDGPGLPQPPTGR